MSEARSAERGEFHGGARAVAFTAAASKLPGALQASYAEEVELRRPLLWRVAAAGAGVLLYFVADREPPLVLCVAALAAVCLLAFISRRHARAHALSFALACVEVGCK